MLRDRLRQWANIVALIATLVINGLASTLRLNGRTTGEVADAFQVYFAPAGYVFAIWAPIYAGLIAFTVYQALPRQRDNLRLRRMGYLFALSCAANIVWLILWHYEVFVLTVVAMVALLLSLIAIYLRLDIGRARASGAGTWLVNVPFSIYLAWITVATIANATSALDYLSWSGWGISDEVWTVIMLMVSAGITWAMGLTRRDVAYALVIAWGLVGIAVKHAGTPTVATGAWVATGLVGLALGMAALLRRGRAMRGTDRVVG